MLESIAITDRGAFALGTLIYSTAFLFGLVTLLRKRNIRAW